jgi:hypothetical protein
MLCLVALIAAVAVAQDDDGQSVEHHWVYKTSSSVPYVHMAMIAALPNNTIAVAFQESSIGEGCNDQSIFFTTSVDGGVTWQSPSVAAKADYACWGPVLHYDVDTSRLFMFYSVSNYQQNRTPTNCGSLGQSYPGGTINYITSSDAGVTWSAPTVILPFDSRGNISKMTANHLLVTPSGSWLLPFWEEGRTVYDLVPDCSAVLISEDKGATWQAYGCISNNASWLIENTVAQASNGSLFQVFRTTLGVLYASWSLDGGYTWSEVLFVFFCDCSGWKPCPLLCPIPTPRSA